MTNQTINPAALYNSVELGFSQAVQSQGQTTLHCSGQVAWDKDCNVIGEGDIGKQAQQALKNLKAVLTEAGAGVSDVVRLRTYVVNHNPALLGPISQAIGEFYEGNTPAANTLIGVQALAVPELLIEIEATVVL